MRISEIYKTKAAGNRIQVNDLANYENGLTIKRIEVIGETRKGILLSFEETLFEHKCNRTDAFEMAKHFKTDEINSFVGKKVYLITDKKGYVRISVEKPKEEPKKNNKKKRLP